MRGFLVSSTRRHVSASSVLVAVVSMLALSAGCSEVRSTVAPSPGGLGVTDHSVPPGFHVASFDPADDCTTPVNSFVSGTPACAKPTGLGNGFTGTLQWIDPSGTAVRTVNITDVNGNYKDVFTPLACGTWTLRLTHHAGEVRTHQFEVTGCLVSQGCSPGFWKQDQHFDDWPNPPAPGDTFQSVFGRLITVNQPGQQSDVSGPTLEQALHATGGGVNRAARIGTAAYLSAVHGDVSYPYTPAQVIQAVQDAIDGVAGAVSIDDLENVWKDVPDHCPLGDDPGESAS